MRVGWIAVAAAAEMLALSACDKADRAAVSSVGAAGCSSLSAFWPIVENAKLLDALRAAEAGGDHEGSRALASYILHRESETAQAASSSAVANARKPDGSFIDVNYAGLDGLPLSVATDALDARRTLYQLGNPDEVAGLICNSAGDTLIKEQNLARLAVIAAWSGSSFSEIANPKLPAGTRLAIFVELIKLYRRRAYYPDDEVPPEVDAMLRKYGQ